MSNNMNNSLSRQRPNTTIIRPSSTLQQANSSSSSFYINPNQNNTYTSNLYTRIGTNSNDFSLLTKQSSSS